MEAKAKEKPQKPETRERLHELVDQLPEDEFRSAVRYLSYLRDMGDPVLKKLMEAPVDDEPVTAEEEALVAEAWESVENGDVRSLDEVEQELGT